MAMRRVPVSLQFVRGVGYLLLFPWFIIFVFVTLLGSVRIRDGYQAGQYTGGDWYQLTLLALAAALLTLCGLIVEGAISSFRGESSRKRTLLMAILVVSMALCGGWAVLQHIWTAQPSDYGV